MRCVIKKNSIRAWAAGALVCITAATGSVAANAFGMYEDINLSGYRYNAKWAQKDGLGTVNRKVSSIENSPGKRFYEGRGYTGRSIYIVGNQKNLKKVNTNLRWFESWNDRIQSYR